MTPLQQTTINDLTCLTADLVKATKTDNLNSYVTTLTSIERLANFTRGQMLKRTYIDPADFNDEDL